MTEPIGSDQLAQLADAALKVGADGVQVLVFHSWGGLTRFASSRIHQNTWREDVEFRVIAVVDGNRTGVSSTHSFDEASVRRAAEEAVAIARIAPGDPEFAGLAPPTDANKPATYDEPTANATPAERAAAVARALGEFPRDMEGAGYVETVADEVLISSTTGLRQYGRTTRAGVSVLATAPDSSGYAERLERRFSDLDAGRGQGRAQPRPAARRAGRVHGDPRAGRDVDADPVPRLHRLRRQVVPRGAVVHDRQAR
jgi:predicted Zn-dependent protease